MADYQAQDTVPAVGSAVSTSRGAASVAPEAAALKASAPVAPPPPQDTVVISEAGRSAAGGQKPSGRGSQGAPDGDASKKAPNRNADDVSFSYHPETQTLQTQVVDPRTGKTVLEIPTDDQIRMQEKLSKMFSRKKEVPASKRADA